MLHELRGFGDSVKQNFLLNLLWLLFVILAGQKCAKDEWIPALIAGASGAASPDHSDGGMTINSFEARAAEDKNSLEGDRAMDFFLAG